MYGKAYTAEDVSQQEATQRDRRELQLGPLWSPAHWPSGSPYTTEFAVHGGDRCVAHPGRRLLSSIASFALAPKWSVIKFSRSRFAPKTHILRICTCSTGDDAAD